MLKRRYVESLKARKYRNQVKEIKVKLVIYNIDRTVRGAFMLVQIEVFYKADFLKVSEESKPPFVSAAFV